MSLLSRGVGNMSELKTLKDFEDFFNVTEEELK